MFPSACRTNVRHSASSRRLINRLGSWIKNVFSRDSAGGIIATVVSQPACPFCR